MSNELPEPWGAELSERGVHSYREFATLVGDGIGHETLRRLVTGGKTSVGTVNKVADKVFAGDRDRVWALRGVALQDHGDWELPPEASLLTDHQREAIRAVVKAMVPDPATAPKLTLVEGAKEPQRDRPTGTAKKAARKETT